MIVKGGRVLSVLATAAVVAACSSNGHGVKTGGTVNYAQQYEADARPVRAATINFLKYQGSLVSPTQAAPFSKAFMTFADVLLAQTWPTSAEADIRKLAATSRQEGTVLQAGLTASDGLQIDQLEGDVTAEAVKVRTDLGLPPPST